MPSLTVGGVTIPVAPGGISRERLDGTDRARAFDQTYRASVTGTAKRDFHFSTPPLPRFVADDLERTLLSLAAPQAVSGDIIGGGSNLILQSENFAATWTVVGTSPLYLANAHTASGVSLSIIEDNNAAALEGFVQTGIAFTGNAVKAISIYVKFHSSTRTVVALQDTTAPAYRMRVGITWSGGLPVLTMVEGTALGYETLPDGVFRILLQSTSVTAANAHQLYVLPATDTSFGLTDTGAVYAGGVQTENALTPGPYIKTTTATVNTLPGNFCAEITGWTPIRTAIGHRVVLDFVLHEA